MLSSTPSQRAVSLRGPRTQDREYPGFDLQIYRLAKSAGIPAAPLPGNGDTIKLGSRLESITKDSSVPIDISEATWVEVNGLFETR